MADTLLDKLARLGIKMLPQAGAMAGGAAGSFGGPAGAYAGELAGRELGVGLGALMSPGQNPLEGGYMIPQGGGGLSMVQSQENPWGRAAGAMGEDLGYQLGSKGIDMAGAKIGEKMGMETASGGMPEMGGDDEYMKLLMRVLKEIPKDDIKRFLEERNKSMSGV